MSDLFKAAMVASLFVLTIISKNIQKQNCIPSADKTLILYIYKTIRFFIFMLQDFKGNKTLFLFFIFMAYFVYLIDSRKMEAEHRFDFW